MTAPAGREGGRPVGHGRRGLTARSPRERRGGGPDQQCGVIRGMGLREVGDLLWFDRASERPATFREAELLQDYVATVYAVQVAVVGDWLLLVEPNGHLAVASPDVPARVLQRRDGCLRLLERQRRDERPRGARRNAGAPVRPTAVRRGRRRRLGERLPAELDLPFGQDDHNPRALALHLAERLTGVVVDGGRSLDELRRTWTTATPAAGPS